MQKIWIILQSEFIRRVRSTAFILATLLVPVFLIGVMVAPTLLGQLGEESSERTVAVVDETGQLFARLDSAAADDGTFTLRTVEASAPAAAPDSLRAAVLAGTYDGYVILPSSLLDADEGEVTYYSTESSIGGPARFENMLEDAVRGAVLTARNVPADIQAIMDRDVDVSSQVLSEEGEAGSGLILTLLGFLMAFAVYFAVFLYGNYVMQGVIEEKSNRVVEIIVSSAKPFELLMGKVLGIGAMGLVQMVVWISMLAAGLTFAGSILTLFMSPADLGVAPDASTQEVMDAVGFSMPTIPPSLIVWFLLFFVGGYLLYSSLFAAVGSAVEQQQDAQNLLYPVFIPLIIPILFVTFVVETPDSTLSLVLSLVPFFSPILMPLRMTAASVPLWQTLLSFVLLVGGFVITIWIASRIYRIGIFMYGKTPSFAEIAKWATYRQ
jgi:ABC-2 type transport system permease protein